MPVSIWRPVRSLLRQDPEVILVGEMRDPATATIALQASLTGQLVLTTFHAASRSGAISRLLDMGIEPYIVHPAFSRSSRNDWFANYARVRCHRKRPTPSWDLPFRALVCRADASRANIPATTVALC